MDFLHRHIEALIFCSKEPLTLADIHRCLSEMFESEIPEEHIRQAIEALEEKYMAEDFSFALEKSGGGFQFLSKPAYQSSISILLKQQSQKRLSTAQLETLSIIAYKQPISKSEMEQIRGVNCDYSVHKLLEKELVVITGKSTGLGRPLLYGTSQKFMDYFGINDIKDLPQPKDFSQESNEIGEKNE